MTGGIGVCGHCSPCPPPPMYRIFMFVVVQINVYYHIFGLSIYMTDFL